jgi:ssDNA thymidine ADP-ribosyltransferase DarT-like protein
MTHVDNLPTVVGLGSLLSTAALHASKLDHANIAYSSIQGQRAAKAVPCGPGGSLHDYVPFYFTRKSPMLYTINRGNVPCAGGQENLIHLLSTAQTVAQLGLGFAFTDGHGIMAYTSFYDDLAHLGQVDWNVIGATYWHDTVEDGDRKRRKQAEFLVRDQFPWTAISHVVVRSNARATQVSAIIANCGHKPQIVVDPGWYY